MKSIRCGRCQGRGLTYYGDSLELCQDCSGAGTLIMKQLPEPEVVYDMYDWDTWQIPPGGYIQ